MTGFDSRFGSVRFRFGSIPNRFLGGIEPKISIPVLQFSVRFDSCQEPNRIEPIGTLITPNKLGFHSHISRVVPKIMDISMLKKTFV